MAAELTSSHQDLLLQSYVLDAAAQKRRAERAHLQNSDSGPLALSPFVPCCAPRIPVFVAATRIQPGDCIWDVGCGDGRVVIEAARRHRYARFVGVDIDAEAVEKARRDAKCAGVEDVCTFLVGDAVQLFKLGLRVACARPSEFVIEEQFASNLPRPDALMLFVTGHMLTTLSPLLHAEWRTGGMRIVTCVESLDACVDYRVDLFDDSNSQLEWPVSRASWHASKQHEVYVVPPAGVTVEAWEAARFAGGHVDSTINLDIGIQPSPHIEIWPQTVQDSYSAAHFERSDDDAMARRKEADNAPVVRIQHLLTSEDIAKIETFVQERAEVQRGIADHTDAAVSAALFDNNAECACSLVEDAFHGSSDATHAVLHLHRGGAPALERFDEACPGIRAKLMAALYGADVWRACFCRATDLRSFEYHHYTPGGSVADNQHRDDGSCLTISCLLQAASCGGELHTFHSDAWRCHDDLKAGDAVVFLSDKRHNVSCVEAGERHSIVMEVWENEANEWNRHK
ncbi:methyltransferase [Pseudoscourfieldia marina]